MNPMNPQGPFNPYSPPGPPMGPPMGGGMGGGGYEYEFSDAENAVISSAAFWARLLGIFLIVTGAVALLNCNVITFGLNLAIGIFFLGGASALGNVVNTQGNDIQHMMVALGKLGTAFKIRVIITIIAVALIALAVVGITALLLLRATH